MTFVTVVPGGQYPLLEVSADVTNAPTNASRVWTDITPYVRMCTATRAGRNDELQRTQPGTLSLIVDNRFSLFDPANGSGLGIGRTQWIRVRAQWAGVTYARWQGLIETIEQSWPASGKDATASITASDAAMVLNLYDLGGQTLTAKLSDQRVNDVVVLAGLTTTLQDAGASTIVASAAPIADSTFASGHLAQVEESENGLVFAGPDGTIFFQSRHYRIVNKQTATDTIGDAAGEIPYETDAQVSSDDAYIFNSVDVVPTNTDGSAGVTQSATDATSQTEHFVRKLNRTILVSDANEGLSAAQWLIGRYAEPAPRIPRIKLQGAALTTKWPTILALNNSDRFTFKRRANVTISQDCYVEQISDTIVPGHSWDISLEMSPAATEQGWLLGVAGYSELGTTTVLSY